MSNTDFDIKVTVSLSPELAERVRAHLFTQLRDIESDAAEVMAIGNDVPALWARALDRQLNPFAEVYEVSGDDLVEDYRWFGEVIPPTPTFVRETLTLRSPAPTLPEWLTTLCAKFRELEPLVKVWERVPAVEEGEDDKACETLSRRFAAYARGQLELDAIAVKRHYRDMPFVDEHWFTVLVLNHDEHMTPWCVDWTARQFYNLETPPAKEHEDLPCPLIWVGDATHPVLGASA